ncbi:hypothetical protein MMC06_003247 [Schaereria dolodes]|nr:hypothetical protein [Schaereria dolodes]
MDRGRDRRYDDRERPLGGETYRPSDRYARSPQRSDNYRAQRSPPRRRTPPFVDTYAPRGGRFNERLRSRSNRRRSRSPAPRGRDNGGSYRGRARSPRGGYSPHRDERARSPVGGRRRSRSPYGAPRARSPPPQKRAREPDQTDNYRHRSPPSKRERYVSPSRDNYERRGHSPLRETHSKYQRDVDFRPKERSRSPPRRSTHVSHAASPISSRRSSPQLHHDRMAMASGAHSPAFSNARQHPPLEHRSPPYRGRERSPPRRTFSPPTRRSPPETRSPQHAPTNYRERSPPRHEREEPRNGVTPTTWSNAQMSAPSGPSYRNGETRAPPSGPGVSRYDSHARDTPSAPPSAPISMSAHNRPSSALLLTAPTQPRGGSSFNREPRRDNSYANGPPSASLHRPNRHYNAPPPHRQSSYDSHSPTSIPTGPRSNPGYNGPSHTSSYESARPQPPFRTNNSSSTTYPRTQRFHQHLGSLPAIIPGGKVAPSGLDLAQEKRLQQLEDDKKKLLEAIEEKQRAKRAGLREWEKAERESAREALRSELAEGHLEKLSGDGAMGGAAY